MKIEKLRKNHKNKIILGGLISIGVISAITILPSFAKYRLTDSINIANGVVNYKVPDLKVMAMYTSEDETNYIEITAMPTSGYIINEERTYCTTDNVNQVKGKAYTNSSGELVFKNLTKSDKCYLYFDKEKSPSEKTMAKLGITPNTGIPNFATAATTDEGVFKENDGMYGDYSYYWRGGVNNNYVKFANFCWRIVRINGDGTIRLIFDGTTCHANGTNTSESLAKTLFAYISSSNKSERAGYTYKETYQRPNLDTGNSKTEIESNLKIQTDSWYKTSILDKGYDDKVTNGKFCNDRNTESGSTWSSQPSSTFYYAAYGRLGIAKIPTLSCADEGDVYNLKVGAITADEIAFAGGVYDTSNSSYYLYNGQSYWTMSPHAATFDGNNSLYMSIYTISTNGALYVMPAHVIFGNARPVINLRSDITFSSGDGTLNNPYEVI